MTPYLEMKSIAKDFPGVRALDGVNIALEKGRILALCGENGAGKSTLMKILSGVYPAGDYEGEIRIGGELQHYAGTRDAEDNGVAIIHQELNLFSELTIAENVFVGDEICSRSVIDWAAGNQKARALINQYNLGLDPQKKVKDLKLGQAQLVEITKALSKNADVLVLDEPTSALSTQEVEKLFEIMRLLKSKGVTMVYISHKMDEIRQICDEVAVIRDGRSVLAPTPVADLTKDDIVKAMVGRDIKTLYPSVTAAVAAQPTIGLEVKNWSVRHPLLIGEYVVENINLQVRQGEIFGIYGLMGSGRTEILTSIFGGFPREDYDGELFVGGKRVAVNNPCDAIDAGIALVTEDRKLFGLVLGMAVGDNLSLASLDRVADRRIGCVIDGAAEKRLIDRLIAELRIKTPSVAQLARNLSGGNQQKIVLGKWLATEPKVLLLDEPTRGVDVGAKAEIYQIMNELKKRGTAIVMVTSELPELMGMSDTVMVMHEGSSVGVFAKKDVTVEKIGALATGNA